MQFFAGLTGHNSDLRLAVEAMGACGQAFCLIGGLALNHYVEPVVTLDVKAVGVVSGHTT